MPGIKKQLFLTGGGQWHNEFNLGGRIAQV